MKREYYIRGRKVTVEEIMGVLAVRLEAKPEEPLSEVAKQFGKLATGRSRKESAFTISDNEHDAFTQAGWIFIHPSPEVTRAAEVGEAPSGATYVGRVFRHPKGRVLIGTDRLTVKLQTSMPEAEVQSVLRDAKLEIIRKFNFAPNLYEVKVAAGKDPLDVAVELHENPAFIYAEPQMIEHIPHRFAPTDPDYDQQWFWNNDGTTGGTLGADIDAEPPWDITRGSGIRIAVIDNGCDVNHPDLEAAIGIGAGYFKDDGADVNFVLGTTDFPNSAHGTQCSGMAIARANNAEGGCGVSNLAVFVPIACLVDQVGTQETLARALAYAADPTTEVNDAQFDGADVISCSLGPSMSADWDMTSVLKDAIDFVVNNGREGLGSPIFWATSNGNVTIDGVDGTDEVVSYEKTIAVGRTCRNDLNTYNGGSAFGPELDFVAPGVRVYLPTQGGGYDTVIGTSFATPCAGGVGALILCINSDLTWDQVRHIIRDTCDQVGGVAYGADGHHDKYGFGRVNAHRAVWRALDSINGRLFCATEDNKLWMRDPVPHDVGWQHIGHANNVVAMTAILPWPL